MLNERAKVVTLKQCEVIIQEGLEAMYKVDRALLIIDNMKLFAAKYENFEAYFQAKWNIINKHHYIFIQSSQNTLDIPLPQNNITRRVYESRK